MDTFIYYIIVPIALIGIIRLFKTKSQSKIKLPAGDSAFNYSVYQSPKVNGSKSLTLVLEGDKIDELGYQIYKSHIADLDKIDILIRDNQTGEIMKIVKDGDSESMIGVSHPEKGHIGYLQFEIMNADLNYSLLD